MCSHRSFSFESDDYYLKCKYCGLRWAIINPNQPEYGFDANGKPIGTDPKLATPNFNPGINSRVAVLM